MSGPEPSWELLRSFLAVLRERSLSGAARRLRLTQPTLGRHIAALEAEIGAPLFTRSPQGLAPTPAAEAMRASAEAMEAAAFAAVRAAASDAAAVSGVVRVTASEMIGAEALPPMLAALRRAHPGVTVELVLNNRSDDLLRREADVAVRMTQPRQAALAARKLGEVGLGLYARRDYLEAAGRPASMGELSGHDLIGFDRETLSAESLGADVSALPRQAFRVRTDSDLAQLALLRAGAGIGVAQHPIAARTPELERLLPQLEFHLPLWLVAHEDRRADAAVRAVLDQLGRGLLAYLGRD